MSDINLTNQIPIALNNILKEEQQYTRKLFHDSLPHLLLSYGNLCADTRVYADIPIEMRQTRAFWRALSHHYCRRPEDTAVDYCLFYLGFSPHQIDEKRLIIDEAARLLTHHDLTNDNERDEWLNQYGCLVFPEYNRYAEVMKMKWNHA